MRATSPTNIQRFLIALVAMTIAIGCRGTKKDDFELPGQTELVIKRFEFRGVENVPVAELKAGLATQKNTWRSAGAVRWIPLLGADKSYFNRVQWQQDLERILTYFYARGYFDAKIVSQNIIEDPEKNHVRIALTISEGEPTKVTSIDVEGVDRLGLRKDLLSEIALSEGDVFTEKEYLQSRKQLRTQLQGAGYAYAEVEGRAVVEAPDHSARVVYYVDPGPLAEFGEVDISGMDDIPASAIREAITFEAGERYSPEKMQETQERIYDLGVFSVVKVSAVTEEREEEVEAEAPVVEPVAEDEELDLGGLGELLDEAQAEATQRAELDPVVPVVIQVKEAKLVSIRVGAGVAAEVARQEARGRADLSHRNFLGGLRKLENFNSAGYAWAPSLFRPREERNQGVIVDSELRFTQPRFIERFTSFRARLRFERDVEQGFTLTSPTAKLGISRKFFGHLTAELSYNFNLYILSGIDAALLDPFLRLQPEYILEYLEQRVSLNFLNNFLNPTRGSLVELQLQEATTYVGRIPFVPAGGDFDYLAPTLGVELYFPFWANVLALRSRAATIYNLGEQLPPIPQRLYAGGADSMRAFGRQRLALYSVSGEAIPIGGFTKVEASVEPRFKVVRNLLGVGDVWVAPFVDAATVLPGALFVQTGRDEASAETWATVASSLLYGVGLGGWWVTPIGPVRIDFAYRLSDLLGDSRFRRCVNEPNVAGTCNADFVTAPADPVRQTIKSPFNVIFGIGHSF